MRLVVLCYFLLKKWFKRAKYPQNTEGVLPTKNQ